jgi:hypothetical protein
VHIGRLQLVLPHIWWVIRYIVLAPILPQLPPDGPLLIFDDSYDYLPMDIN